MLSATQIKRFGFGLVALLVIIAIIAILLALLLPAVQKVREAAARTHTINNFRQLAIAIHNVNDVHRKLPPAYGKFRAFKDRAASLSVHVLPYLEQVGLYEALVKAQNLDKADAKDIAVPVFVSPMDPSDAKNQPVAGAQNCAANLRVFSDKGVKAKWDAPLPALGDEEPGSATIPATFIDGTSNTVLFSTKYAVCGKEGGSLYLSRANTKHAAFFGQNPAKITARSADPTATFLLMPAPDECIASPLMAQSFMKTSLIVGWADGSVRTVLPNIAAKTWNLILQPNDGIETPNDF